MISDILQEIRERAIYVSEVQRHVHGVLMAFQQDAQKQGTHIVVAVGTPDVTGGTVELSRREPGNSSTVNIEINCVGDMLIWREQNGNFGLESDEPERRLLDLSKPTVSTAVEVLLTMAEDHRGLVGETLERYLRASAFKETFATPDAPGLK